jgi:hypothetical protein
VLASIAAHRLEFAFDVVLVLVEESENQFWFLTHVSTVNLSDARVTAVYASLLVFSFE